MTSSSETSHDIFGECDLSVGPRMVVTALPTSNPQISTSRKTTETFMPLLRIEKNTCPQNTAIYEIITFHLCWAFSELEEAVEDGDLHVQPVI